MSTRHRAIDNRALLDGWILRTPTIPESENTAGPQALAEKRATIAKHQQAMDSLSSDLRIRYLTEHGFDDSDIRRLLDGIQRVVNRDYGATIRQMATNHARQGNGLGDLADDVSRRISSTTLLSFATGPAGETDVIAAVYANHELWYTLNAALNVAMTAQEQTDEEAARGLQCSERDQILADIGLAEDARLWPKS